MKIKILPILALLCFAGVKNSFGQSKLNNYFDSLFSKHKFMGSVAISHNDSIIYSKAVGYANVETHVKNNLNTKFRIGSLTKTFTATLVLKAVEEGKLKLTDLLSSYYPEVRNAAKITIDQMLKHRSGIFNFTEIDGELEWEQNLHTEAQFIAFFNKQKSNFDPGTDYRYSNTNYTLLGFILQKVYKQPFAKILEEKICKPMHLKNTYYTFSVDPTKNEALSYNIQNKFLKNGNVNFSNHVGNGGIVSTPIDLNKFLYSLFHCKIIDQRSLDAMLPVNKGEYGMGIEKLSINNPVGFGHNGRVENYFSNYWYFPKENLGVVTLANAVNISTGGINNLLTRYAFGIEPELPNFDKTKNLSTIEFARIKGTYIDKDHENTITISSDGQDLVFQNSMTGQDYVSFENLGNNVFKFEEITLSFFPNRNEVKLVQGNIKETYKKIHD